MMLLNYKNLKLHLFIAISWFLVYSFNFYLLAPLEYKTHISFIFLPAGLKIAAATIFRIEAAIGLFLGSLLTGYLYIKGEYRHDIVIFSVLNTLSPIAAVYSINLFKNIGKQCEHLTFNTAIAIAIIYSFYSAFFHTFYLYEKYSLTAIEFTQDFIAMFVGDLSGAIIFLTVLASQRKRIIHYFMNLGS